MEHIPVMIEVKGSKGDLIKCDEHGEILILYCYMTKHLCSAQRYHLFVEHQKRGTRKEKTHKEIVQSPRTNASEASFKSYMHGSFI